jgi:2-haloalkanoic acid dehalogenase type II
MTRRAAVRITDFDALSFDCYGTLIDWEAGLLAVLRPWARANGLTAADSDVLEAFGRHEGRIETANPAMAYPDVLRRTFEAIGRDLGAPVTGSDAERLGESVGDWPAFPDSAAALSALAARYKLIILSNVDRASFAASNRKLGVTFDAILTAEDIGSYKPSPRNFEALLARAQDLGVGDGKLLHVAQSLFHDHVPAKAAGLPTAWINRRGGLAGWGATPAADAVPDWEFASMAEFAEAAAEGR